MIMKLMKFVGFKKDSGEFLFLGQQSLEIAD